MVSHELRTPMNGVLGMLELMKSSRLDRSQAMFLRHAGRSGHAMLHVIEALLDISDIRDAQFRLEPAEFALDDLAGAIGARLAPLLDPACSACTIAIEGGTSRRFAGDRDRIAQLASQIVFHLVDGLGAAQCRCSVGLRDGELEIAVRLDGRQPLRWSLASVLHPEAADGDHPASEASGPAVARELIRLMGARAEVMAPDPAGSGLRVVIPPAAAEPGAVAVPATGSGAETASASEVEPGAVLAERPDTGLGTGPGDGKAVREARRWPVALLDGRQAGAAPARGMVAAQAGAPPGRETRAVLIDHGRGAGRPAIPDRRATGS
jgi:hypothetical protein